MNILFAPFVLEQDYLVFQEAYKNGNLVEVVKNRRIIFLDKEFENCRFDRWDIVEAIESYFNEYGNGY